MKVIYVFLLVVYGVMILQVQQNSSMVAVLAQKYALYHNELMIIGNTYNSGKLMYCKFFFPKMH